MSLADLEKWKPGGEFDRASTVAFKAFQRGDYEHARAITRALVATSRGPLALGVCLWVVGAAVLVGLLIREMAP